MLLPGLRFSQGLQPETKIDSHQDSDAGGRLLQSPLGLGSIDYLQEVKSSIGKRTLIDTRCQVRYRSDHLNRQLLNLTKLFNVIQTNGASISVWSFYRSAPETKAFATLHPESELYKIKTETIIATKPDLFMYGPNNIMHMTFIPKSWQKNNSFSISSDYTKTKRYYYDESSGKTFVIEKWYQSKDDLKVPQRP